MKFTDFGLRNVEQFLHEQAPFINRFGTNDLFFTNRILSQLLIIVA
jgi:hypothetical protein